MEKLQNEKLTPLVALYQQFFEETRRYRNMEWKILLWTIALMAGIVAVTRSVPVQSAHKPYVQTLLWIFTIGAAAYGIWHIWFVHKQFIWNRNKLKMCEKIFKFFENNVYNTNSILPRELEKAVPRSHGLPHLISWFALIALTAIYAIYSIIFIKTI